MTELTELKLLGAYFGFFLVLGIGFVLKWLFAPHDRVHIFWRNTQ